MIEFVEERVTRSEVAQRGNLVRQEMAPAPFPAVINQHWLEDKAGDMNNIGKRLLNKLGFLVPIELIRQLGTKQRTGPKRYEQMDEHGHWRKIRRWSNGTMFGTAFLPRVEEEWAHGSRQVRRHALRCLNFARISNQFPGESRRQRRKMARAAARIQFQAAQREILA